MSLKGMNALKRRYGSIKKAIERDLFEEAATQWVELDFKPAAKALAPVRTGELRDSIDGSVNPRQVKVFASAPHAIHVEEGTSRQPAQPFMRPAFDQTRRKLSQYMRDALRRRL